MSFLSTSSTSCEIRVSELDVHRDPRYRDFVESHPHSLIYHHPTWIRTLEREYGRQCICLASESPSGKLLAVLPLMHTKGLPFRFGPNATGRRLSSLPRTPIAGPLSLDERAAKPVLKAAIEIAKSMPGVQLEIKSEIPGLEEDIPGLSCVPWRFTYIEELPPVADGTVWEDFCENLRIPRNCGSCKDCRRLRFGNAKRQHKVNWAVNKALKLGLQVRFGESEQDLREWYPLYLQTMRHNAIPPRSLRFFLQLWSSMRPVGHLQLLLAEQRTESGARLVAGSVLLMFGQTVAYAFTGCGPDDLPLHAHDLLQIEAIRSSCKSGFRWYDFGEVTEDHESLAQFKGKWGTEPQRLYRYYYPAVEPADSSERGLTSRLARQAWRLLPLSTTKVLGDLIYRFM